jgi:cytochrome c-type biogenesis protein CcmH/NrfG
VGQSRNRSPRLEDSQAGGAVLVRTPVRAVAFRAFAGAGRYTGRMRDQGPGRSPEFENGDDEDRQRAHGLQRAFMDRARRAVEREQAPTPRRVGQRVVALIAALALTFGIVFVFDAFLSSMQKVMRMLDEQEERQKQEEIERKKKEPMPAYVVPSD